MQFDILRKNLLPTACTRIYDRKNMQWKKMNCMHRNKKSHLMFYFLRKYMSAFRDRGVPKPTSECAACPSPDGSSAKGGKRGGRIRTWERWKSCGLRVRPAPRSGALAVGGYKRPRGWGNRAAPRERLSPSSSPRGQPSLRRPWSFLL
jgi:hypothetical protein